MHTSVIAWTFDVGAHALYTAGGDIETSRIGYGGQVELGRGDYLALELSGTLFSDEGNAYGYSAELDTVSIGVSLKCYLPLLPSWRLFVLGGANYNTMDYRVDVSGDGAYGDLTVDLGIEDGVGYHAGAGACFRWDETLTAFAEYRFTAYEVEGSLNVPELGYQAAGRQTYNFGYAKLGLNLSF